MRGGKERTCVVRGCCCSSNRRRCGTVPGACLERSLFFGNQPTLKYTTAWYQKSNSCDHSVTRKFSEETALDFFSNTSKKSKGVENAVEIVLMELIHSFTCDIVDFSVHTGKVCDAQAQHAGLGPQVPLLSAVATVALGTEPSLRRFTIHLESPAQTHKRGQKLVVSASHTLTRRRR